MNAMPAPRPRAARLPALVLALLAGGLAPAAAALQAGGWGPVRPGVPQPLPAPHTLGNALAEFDFVREGTKLELVTARSRIAGTRPIHMADGTGSWTIRLAAKDAWPLEYLDVSMDGSACDAGGCADPANGRLDELRLEWVRLGLEPRSLRAHWSGVVTFQGTTVPFVVDTDWKLPAGSAFVSTRIGVRLLSPAPLPFYVSHVTYPAVHARSFDSGSDALVVPWVSGNLVTTPTDPDLPFPAWTGHRGVFLADQGTFLPVSVSAYYDGAKPVSTSLVYTADPGDHYWKDLLIAVTPDGAAPGSVDYDFRHVPDDIYDSRSWAQPYDVRIGAVTGDWWDAADAYRDMLTAEVPWYHGPVGSPANPMPASVKEVVAEVYFMPGYKGDHMDMLAQQMTNLTRVLGPRVNAVWYGWHAPDEFDRFQLYGSLPARPSLGGGLREATRQFGHFVSPYFNSSGALWWQDVLPPIGNPTPLMLQAEQAFVIQEDGEMLGHADPLPRTGFLDPGSDFWHDGMADQLLDLAEFTDMNGVYLDVFLTVPNYADDPLAFLHPPGGGRWMFDARMQQLRRLKTGLDDLDPPPGDFLVTIEFVVGRFTEEVHIMHVDPADNMLSANENPAHEEAVPMENAVTIPFFRAIYDNVKLSRITIKKPSVVGRQAWTVANNVLTFGQIPSVVRPGPEMVPIFSDRFAIAPYFNFPGFPSHKAGLLGGSGGGAPPPPGAGDSGAATTEEIVNDVIGPFEVAPDDVYNTPLYGFLSGLGTALRGDLSSLADDGDDLGSNRFMKWHSGTIRRLPGYTITQVGGTGFTGIPGVELEPDPATPYTATPVYTEEYPNVGPDPYPNPVGPYLVPGMFQAPPDINPLDAGSLAFIMANPWVDPTQTATFQVDFTVVPDGYEGWRDGAPHEYSVTRYDVSGDPAVDLGTHVGPFAHTDVLAGGDIVWWVFRKL